MYCYLTAARAFGGHAGHYAGRSPAARPDVWSCTADVPVWPPPGWLASPSAPADLAQAAPPEVVATPHAPGRLVDVGARSPPVHPRGCGCLPARRGGPRVVRPCHFTPDAAWTGEGEDGQAVRLPHATGSAGEGLRPADVHGSSPRGPASNFVEAAKTGIGFDRMLVSSTSLARRDFRPPGCRRSLPPNGFEVTRCALLPPLPQVVKPTRTPFRRRWRPMGVAWSWITTG